MTDGDGAGVKTAEQLQAMIEDWTRELPRLAERLERPELIATGHRHYETIMCLTPAPLQDEIYEALHLLMYRHGLCARPRWSQSLSASAERPQAIQPRPEPRFRRR